MMYRERFISGIFSMVWILQLTACAGSPPTQAFIAPTTEDEPGSGHYVPRATVPAPDSIVSTISVEERLSAACLAIPAWFFRPTATEMDKVRFYQYEIGPDFFETPWALVGEKQFDLLDIEQPRPAGSNFVGYAVDENDAITNGLNDWLRRPRLDYLVLPFNHAVRARHFREIWTARMVERLGFRSESKNEVVYLETDPPEDGTYAVRSYDGRRYTLYTFNAAAVVLNNGQLILLQSNTPDLIRQFIEAGAPCPPPPVRTTPLNLSRSVTLEQGSYNIPYHTEPDNDIILTRTATGPERFISEYVPYGPDNLEHVDSEVEPLAITAYIYSPQAEDLEDAGPDYAELRANPLIQVCLNCFGFYLSGRVLVLEFLDDAAAAMYMEDLFKHEFGERGGVTVGYQHGATYTDPYLAFRQAGRYIYIVQSWTSDTMEAILAGNLKEK